MAGRGAWASIALALVTLASCAPSPFVDKIPESFGGLPQGTPDRPVAPYQYPAVHDMPPARQSRPMTEEELDRAQKDLEVLRDRQAKAAADPDDTGPKKDVKKDTKKKPSPPKTGQNTGAKTNP